MCIRDRCCVEGDCVWRCKQNSTVYPPSQLPDSWENLGSTDTAVSYTHLGKLLIFPEGTRVHEGEDVAAKGGAALFATRTASPILPVYVTRKKPWFRPTTVVFGQPFHPQIAGRKATAEELDQITHTVMDQILSLIHI